MTHATVLGVAISMAVAATAMAQGNVTGVLSLEERPGADHGDVTSAVVYLEARGHVIPAASYRSTGTIEMRGREFRPHVRVVQAGGSVAFPNEDPFSHNVFSNVELGPFDLGLYRRGATHTATFNKPGVYPIYCNIHSQMVSFVVAVPTPWAAQPDGAGHFVLHDVPAGEYVLHVWHERAASEVTRDIVVPAEGAGPLDIQLDARAYVQAPHLNKFGRPYMILRADRY